MGQFPRSDWTPPRGSERFYSCEMFMIESRNEKKEDGLRSPLTESRRGAEPKVWTPLPHVCAGVALEAGSHRRYHHGIGSPMRRALVSGEGAAPWTTEGQSRRCGPLCPMTVLGWPSAWNWQPHVALADLHATRRKWRPRPGRARSTKRCQRVNNVKRRRCEASNDALR